MKAHHQIYYDRILPYRVNDPKLQRQFVKIYVEAFNDPNGAYSETNSPQSVLDEVWHHHINDGRISLAIDINKSTVVGLACLERIEKASTEEQQHTTKVFDYLKTTGVRNAGLPIWYFSELAVLKGYRNREDHIGTELIDLALQDLRCCNHDGKFGHDNKMFVLTRTDTKRSMSINAFKRAGFTFLEDILQNAQDADHVTKHDSKSIEKIWGYKVVYPICGW